MAYADPTSRLAVCVSTCPSPPSLADGAEPAYQLCTYGTVATAAATLADPHPHPHPHPNATSGCYPSYASVAVQGYCVPSSVAAQSSYDEAGVGLDAAALSSLQSDLLSASGRYFDATFGDVLLMWPLLLGIPLVVALLALGWSQQVNLENKRDPVLVFLPTALHTATRPFTPQPRSSVCDFASRGLVSWAKSRAGGAGAM